RGPKMTAFVGQTAVHAGSSPTARRCRQNSHFTMAGFSAAHSNFGTWYGQATSQYRHPMHLLGSHATTPSLVRLKSASNGQADTHAGSRQCMHCCLTNDCGPLTGSYSLMM